MPNKYPIKFNQQKQIYSIGRKPTADINFTEDHHLSNIHAKIQFYENEVCLEDMGSTNGLFIIIKYLVRSWLRLSKEGEVSDNHKLCDEISFKIGTTSTYICKK